MITKINKIKDFGIFQDFTWDTALTPFKQKNLIYGWNYSGKTTLSKILNSLNKNNKFVYFPNAKYIIETTDSKTYNQDSLQDFPYLVEVFNADYVKHIFAWDKENNDGFQPISFYLGDKAGDIQPRIDKLKTRWNPKITKIQEHSKLIVEDFEEYDKDNGKFAKQATIIRGYLNDRILSHEFNKRHFGKRVNDIKHDVFSYNIKNTDRLKELKEQAILDNEWKEQNITYNLIDKLKHISEKVKNVLEDTAPQSMPFPELDNNKNLFNWVQTGLNLHTNSTKCKFCDNELTRERINALNQYYSQKLKDIQEIIAQINKEIDNNIEDIKKLEINFPHESSIATHLRTEYLNTISNFKLQKEKYLDVFKIFKNELTTKEENYFTPIKATPFIEISIKNELEAIIKVIEEHNNYKNDFNNRKQQALDVILKHYVAAYLIEEDYLNKEKEYNVAQEIVKRCDSKVKSNNTKILELEGKLKDTIRGQEELNTYLKIFLNRDDIRIDTNNHKYVLKRGVELAKYLSEGEKTAIAFAYFLTVLKSLKEEGKLKETIIFIDDPISSLDSNHIFQVRSLIQHFFSKDDEYKQLFISTHNFEFFSVLLDSDIFKPIKNNNNKVELYSIIRKKEESKIKALPIQLKEYKSEYVHLFYILKNYYEYHAKEEYDYILLLPNALRRFLELYTLMKYPGKSEIDKRIKKVFNVQEPIAHNIKLYHWFSHQQQFEKVAQHDDKIFSIDGAIEEVMLHIKDNDKLHWKGLTGEE